MPRLITISMIVCVFATFRLAAQESEKWPNDAPDGQVDGPASDLDLWKLENRRGDSAQSTFTFVVQVFKCAYPEFSERMFVNPNGGVNFWAGTPEKIEIANKAFSNLSTIFYRLHNSIKESDVIRAVNLTNADSTNAVAGVKAKMGAGTQMRIDAIGATNTILLGGPKAEVERTILELKAADRQASTDSRLDAGVGAPPGSLAAKRTKVFRLKSLRAADAAQTVKQLVTDSDLTLQVEGSSNSLIVAGASEQVAEVEALLQNLGALRPNEEENATQIKVFQLQRMDALAATMLVRKLFADVITSELKVDGDPRTNSLIASGSQKDLQVIEALLLKLDSTEAQQPIRSRAMKYHWGQQGGAAKEDVVTPQYDVARLRRDYKEFQSDVRRLAEKYDNAQEINPSDKKLAFLRQQLAESVNRAFDIRQTLQAAEVEQLRLELAAIEARIQVREMSKRKIVTRRIRDLIGEEAAESYKAESENSSSTAIKGPVQIESIEGLDVMVIRGKQDDVRATIKVIEQIEDKGKADSTDE